MLDVISLLSLFEDPENQSHTGCPKKNAQLRLEAYNFSLGIAIGTCRTIFGLIRFSAFIWAKEAQDSVHGTLRKSHFFWDTLYELITVDCNHEQVVPVNMLLAQEKWLFFIFSPSEIMKEHYPLIHLILVSVEVIFARPCFGFCHGSKQLPKHLRNIASLMKVYLGH